MTSPSKNTAVDILTAYCDAYNQRDLNQLLKLFTTNCFIWGTGLDEVRVGIKAMVDQHERDWEQSDKSEIHIVDTVSAPENANWAASTNKALITINGEQHTVENLRGSICIAEEDGQWKIAFMHASFPDQRNAPGDSFPV